MALELGVYSDLRREALLVWLFHSARDGSSRLRTDRSGGLGHAGSVQTKP